MYRTDFSFVWAEARPPELRAEGSNRRISNKLASTLRINDIVEVGEGLSMRSSSMTVAVLMTIARAA